MWHQWFNRNFMKLWEYKENKYNDFIHQFLLFRVRLWRAFMGSTMTYAEPAFWRRIRMLCALFASRGMYTHALWYCREHASKSDTEEKKLLNKVIFLCTKCILIASKIYGWTPDVTWTILTMSLLPFWALWQLRCCLCRVRELLDFIKNILICVLKMNEGLTGLEQHEGE